MKPSLDSAENTIKCPEFRAQTSHGSFQQKQPAAVRPRARVRARDPLRPRGPGARPLQVQPRHHQATPAPEGESGKYLLKNICIEKKLYR